MARIIKAPNIQTDRPLNLTDREKYLRHVEDEAALIINNAYEERSQLMESAEQEIADLTAQAQQEAETILEQARAEAEQIKSAARQQAHNQGLTEGQEEARRQVANVLKDLRNLIVEGQRLLEALYVDQEPEIRKIVCEIVNLIIQEKIQEDDTIVVRVAQACIRKVADRQNLRVLIHPEDKQKIEEWSEEFMRLFDDIEKIHVETDPRVKRGGVMIESGSGGVDGRIDKQCEIMTDTIINP